MGNAKVKTPVVETQDECEPDYWTSESDDGITSELEKPTLNIFSIPELPELKFLEYANKVKAFIDLKSAPDVASDSPTDNENEETKDTQSLKLKRDDNVVDDSEDVQASNISLCQPDIVDKTDESDIDIPIDDIESKCFLVESDNISVSKELSDEPVAAPIDTNSNGNITNNTNLEDVDDISASKGLDDEPDALSISHKNSKELELSENDLSGNILFDDNINKSLESVKEDSNLGVTENNLENVQIYKKDDAISDSVKKNDFLKLDRISKSPLSDSKKSINDLEIPGTYYHDVCETAGKYLNCSEDAGDAIKQSDSNDEKTASVVNGSAGVSDSCVDSIKAGQESIDNINLNDSKANELLPNDDSVTLSNGSLEFHKKDNHSSVWKEPVLFFGEEILLSSDTNNSNVNEDERDPNLKFGAKDMVDSKNCLEETNQDSEQNPNIEQLRRLSSDIVKSILVSAESELKNINEQSEKEYIIDINQLSDEKNPGKNTLTLEVPSNSSRLCKDTTEKIKNKSKEFDNSNSQETESKQTYPTEVINQNLSSMALTTKTKGDMGKSNAESYVDPDIVCGIGSFKPQWLQPWATARVYLVLYSIVGILSGSYYSYLIGCISTLEKRFAFKSKLSGSVLVVDEITPLFLGVLVGYFGGRAHRPRMVAVGMMMSSLACFVSVLPYFIYGPVNHLHSMSFQNTTTFDKCEADVKVEECNEDDRPPTLAAVLFLMLGSFLKGFGNLAYYAVGLAYMDDNAKKKNTPIYLAFAYSLRLLGPLVGYLMSYSFLKYYENPFVDPGFGPEDPRWIGGWWMGFMLQGVLVMVFSAPIALFPRRLPGHKLAAETVRKGEGLASNLAGLWAALKRLGKNPLFIFLFINTVFSIYGSFGHFIMLPKYMENQFRVSASQASLLSGPPGITALIVSTLIGGYLVYRLRPNARFLTGCLVILEAIGAVGYLILMIPKCETIQMSNYGFDGQGLILEGACNANCSCSTKAFTPVCAPDGKTHFFSPCHAGCQEKVNQTFSQCSCIADLIDSGENSATEGFCVTHGCWNQALAYIITLPILQFIVNLLRVADTMVFLRCIKTEDKSVALGTFETFVSAFGFLPYPIVFGALVDSACLVWEKSCGQTGNCWFYDISKFNYLLHGGSALFSGLSALCMFVVFCLSGRVTDLYKDDEELDENVKEGTVKEVKEEADASMTRF